MLQNYPFPTLEEGSDNETAQDVPFAAPDSGWSWVVLVGAFICLMFLEGTASVFGMFILDMDEEWDMKMLTSLLISSRGALIHLMGPFAALLV